MTHYCHSLAVCRVARPFVVDFQIAESCTRAAVHLGNLSICFFGGGMEVADRSGSRRLKGCAPCLCVLCFLACELALRSLCGICWHTLTLGVSQVVAQAILYRMSIMGGRPRPARDSISQNLARKRALRTGFGRYFFVLAPILVAEMISMSGPRSGGSRRDVEDQRRGQTRTKHRPNPSRERSEVRAGRGLSL